MPIRRVKIPKEHIDIIEELGKDRGYQLLVKALAEKIKDHHDEFWKAIKEAIPELKDLDGPSLHYNSERKEVYWID